MGPRAASHLRCARHLAGSLRGEKAGLSGGGYFRNAPRKNGRFLNFGGIFRPRREAENIFGQPPRRAPPLWNEASRPPPPWAPTDSLRTGRRCLKEQTPSKRGSRPLFEYRASWAALPPLRRGEGGSRSAGPLERYGRYAHGFSASDGAQRRPEYGDCFPTASSNARNGRIPRRGGATRIRLRTT